MSNSYKRRWKFSFVAAFLATIVTVILSGMMVPATAQAQFRDIQGHWAQPCIEALAQRKIINGYPDGSFRPNAPVTRAEFASLVIPAFPAAVNATRPFAPIEFRDVPRSHWAYSTIANASAAEFLAGYPGNIFRPNQNISRAQVLTALVSGLNYAPTQPVTTTLNTTYSDAQSIPAYARTAIAAATERGIVVNYSNVKQLNPNQSASRAEVAAFLCQTIQGTAQAKLIPSRYIAGSSQLPATNPPTEPRTEIRGVWLTNIDSEVLFSKQNLSNGLQQLAQLNFNTVYPTVWNWGHTLYPSKVAESVIGRAVDPEPGLQDRDMLAEIVEQGHQKGFTVIPWFEFGMMAPADSALALSHPDWLTTRRDGSRIVKEGKYDRVWLNPFKPEVQQFLINLISEIVTNYDADGIQLDDHFGMPVELGYDEFTVQLYRQEHQGQAPPSNPLDPEWMRWRADKLTNLMSEVFRVVKARKPKAIMALSPNPQKFSYETFLQDWESWERRGLVEELTIQLYRPDLERFTIEMAQPEVIAARDHIPVAIGILTGLKGRPSPMTTVRDQVQAVRDRGFAGVSFFFYETLWNGGTETVNERKQVFQTLFAKAVERPDTEAQSNS